MDPNHRDRIAFARLCSGKLRRGMKAKLVRTEQADHAVGAAILFRAGPRARRRGLCRRRGRHPQPRHVAHRRYAHRGRGYRLPRRAEFRAGNSAAREARRPDEGQEAEGSAAADGGGGRRAGVPAARRRAGAGRRGRAVAARRAQGAARRRIRPRHRLRDAGIPARALDCHAPTPRSSTISCRPIIRAWPRIWTAIACSWRATSSSSTTPPSAPPASCSAISRT